MKTLKKNRLPSPEKGSILVWTALILGVLIAFAGLATDIPYLYVARRQAQTAADAGVLAGVYSLLLGAAQAKTDAKAFAGKTPIIGQFLTTSQVDAFACNSNGGTINPCTADSANPDQVTCVAYRDVAHNDPMPLFLLPVLQLFGLGKATATSSGWNAANVSAIATARLSNACSGNCFMPWSIADRWVDTNNDGTFEAGIDQYGPTTTGYQYPQDNGLQVTLKVGNPQKAITPGFYYAVDFPPLWDVNKGWETPITGASQYRTNIETCSPTSFVAVGDELQVETGNMAGPTVQGVQDLINQDPTAFWDTSCSFPGGCVNSPFGLNSPRLIRIAFSDPTLPVSSGRTYVTVIKVGGFFIAGLDSKNNVIGYFTQAPAFGGTPNPSCAGLQTATLVQ